MIIINKLNFLLLSSALTVLFLPSVVSAQDNADLADLTINSPADNQVGNQGQANNQSNEQEIDVVIEQIDDDIPSDDLLNDLNEDFNNIDNTAPSSPLVPYSGEYFDADAVASSSALGQSSVPRQVDPKYVPGSRYVIVRKDAEAGSFTARLTAAQRANDLGRHSAALELYEQLYKESPKSKSVLLGLAIAQQNSGFTQSAIGTYEELLNIDSKNIDAEVNMLGLIMQNYPAIAFQKLIALWEKDSSNPAIAAQVGLTSAKLGNVEDAMRFLGIAASLEPNNASHYYNLAVVTDRAGAYQDAIDFYQKSLEVDAVFGGNRSVPRTSIYDRLAKLRRL